MCQVEEESIRDNFVICYELLDELIDFGYPQTTDAKILQEYITQVLIFTRNEQIYCELCRKDISWKQHLSPLLQLLMQSLGDLMASSTAKMR